MRHHCQDSLRAHLFDAACWLVGWMALAFVVYVCLKV